MKRKADDTAGRPDVREETEKDEFMEELVDVTFDFQSPRESDFHAVDRLLVPLFPDCSGLSAAVDGICSPSDKIGTTIFAISGSEEENEDEVMSGEEDPVGIVSLIEAQPDMVAYATTASLLTDINKRVLVLINSRMINLPDELIPPAFDILLKEIESSKMLNDPNAVVLAMSKMFRMTNSGNGQWEHYQFENEILANEAMRVKTVKPSSQPADKNRTTDAVFYDQEIEVKVVGMEIAFSSFINAAKSIIAMK